MAIDHELMVEHNAPQCPYRRRSLLTIDVYVFPWLGEHKNSNISESDFAPFENRLTQHFEGIGVDPLNWALG